MTIDKCDFCSIENRNTTSNLEYDRKIFILRLTLKDFGLALSVPIIWGMGFTFAKAGLKEFPPLFLMSLRFALSALILCWFFPPPVGQFKVIFLLALVSATIQYGLTFTGLKGLDASTAVFLVQLEVPFGALLASIIFKDNLRWIRALGMAVAFFGVGLIAGAPSIRNQWYHILKKYDVNQAMPFLLLLPVSSIMGAVLFLGERPNLGTMLGGTIIIIGVAIIVFTGQWMAPIDKRYQSDKYRESHE